MERRWKWNGNEIEWQKWSLSATVDPCCKTIQSALQNHSIRVAKPFDLRCKTVQCVFPNHSIRVAKPFDLRCKTVQCVFQTIRSTLQNHSNHVVRSRSHPRFRTASDGKLHRRGPGNEANTNTDLALAWWSSSKLFARACMHAAWVCVCVYGKYLITGYNLCSRLHSLSVCRCL